MAMEYFDNYLTHNLFNLTVLLKKHVIGELIYSVCKSNMAE